MPAAIRPLAATAAAMVILLAAIVTIWMTLDSGVLATTPPDLSPPRLTEVPTLTEVPDSADLVLGNVRVSQPRDPFKPLIAEPSPTASSDPSEDKTSESGNLITLQGIRDLDGSWRATVLVGGMNYDVGVGETFAGSYKVLALTETGGVFMLGDRAFDLTIGQQILK